MDDHVPGKISDADMLAFLIFVLTSPMMYLAICMVLWVADGRYRPIKAAQCTWNELCNEWEWATEDELSFDSNPHDSDEHFDYL